MTPEEIARLQAENDRLRAENEAHRAEARKMQQAENAEFLERLMSQGKLAPIAKAKAESLLNYASDYDNGDTLNFSDGESLTQQVKDFLNAQPQFMIFGEIATKERAMNAEPPAVEYADNADPERIELDQRIRRYMAQHKISYTDACLAITQGEK